MELLIPGLILVALMVYASTKIKKTAAAAFVAETIDTPDVFLEKPEGFLNVINLRDGLALDIYSKDLGSGSAKNMKQARAEMRIYEGRRVADLIAAAGDLAKITSKSTEIVNGRKYHLVEAEAIENEIGFRQFYKFAESNGRVFEFKMVTLDAIESENLDKVESIIASLTVK